MTINDTGRTIVLIFTDPNAAPYFLRPGESLSPLWRHLTIASIRQA